MWKYVFSFWITATVAGVFVNGYYAFAIAGEGLHGYETGMPRFVLGMSYWFLVASSNAIGFAAAMSWAPPRHTMDIQIRGIATAAMMGFISLVSIPLLMVGSELVPLVHISPIVFFAYWILGSILIAWGLSLLMIVYLRRRCIVAPAFNA